MTKAQEQLEHAGQQSDSGTSRTPAPSERAASRESSGAACCSYSDIVASRPPSYMEETPAPAEVDGGNPARPVDNNINSSLLSVSSLTPENNNNPNPWTTIS
ncbi:hypothetical protein BDQ17DRAFT_1327387 [Cyathus striatus]|nr:hypothetical protein BDQ17DRAFT_1327387 [Cyathus striatus]